MTNQIVTKSEPKQLKDYLDMPSIRRRFEDALGGSGAVSFITGILNAAVTNPKIMECDPITVINAGLQAAALNLSLSPSLGQAAIIPFGKKATMCVMRKGLVQLALETDKYRYIHVAKIYEGQIWNEDQLTGRLTLTGARTGNNIIGYVAYFQLLSGFEKYLAMSKDEIIEHAKRYSKSFDRKSNNFYPGSGWADNFEKMCEKTPLRLLLLNYGPMNKKLQSILDSENETGEVEPVDAEFVERAIQEEAEQPKQEPRTVQQNMLALYREG
jgi:recombination protein RecT